jgi:hypothetical protein
MLCDLGRSVLIGEQLVRLTHIRCILLLVLLYLVFAPKGFSSDHPFRILAPTHVIPNERMQAF